MTCLFNFITNNVKGLRDKKARLKIFSRLKDQISHRGIILMQETHSCPLSQKTWEEEFGNENKLLFSHGKSNARGVAIGICGNLDYDIIKTESDNEGRFLIVEIKIGNEVFILINLYNENNECDQLKLLSLFEKSMEKFEPIDERNIILAGDFNFIFDLQLDAKGGNPTQKKTL